MGWRSPGLVGCLCLSLVGLGCGVDRPVTDVEIGAPDAGPDQLSDGGPAPSSFDSHTVSRLETVEQFFELASQGEPPEQLKFVLVDFNAEEGGVTHLMDAGFYKLHDEWYWWHLLNGQAIPGLDVEPVEGLGPFESIADIYEVFSPGDEDLPLDLKFYGERLYSPKFYQLGLYQEPRFFGLGSIVHYPANPDRVAPDELWLVELEFTDSKITEPLLERFFHKLEAAVPAELAPRLMWLVRSLEQEVLADEIVAAGGPLADRILTYADLVVPGEVKPYNPGITAGKPVRLFKDQLGAASMEPDEIIILEAVPDDIPPVAGIITAVPQTPLAHINLLAKSRGTPNAYVAGVLEDAWLEDMAKWHREVILKVDDGAVTWKPISEEDYEAWLALKTGGVFPVPVADLEGAPIHVDLTAGGLADVPDLVPLCGGKAAAMMGFQDVPEIAIPDAPLAITVRAYAEHMEALQEVLALMMEDEEFEAYPEVRFLALEGEEDFREEHAGYPGAIEWVDQYMDYIQGSPMGALVAAGGFKRFLRDQPLDAATEEALQEVLIERYGHLAPTQGLRFRSSSTAEDVEGFNGAGLYDSNTGYLQPELQATDKLKKRSVAWALKKTWASYWGFPAFEERRHAKIDHLAGRMGVLIHPRFDDPLELANGVLTLTVRRGPDGELRELVTNMQKGALSVTNPDPENPAAPEIVRVTSQGEEPPTVERTQASSEVSEGEVLLTDEQLLSLLDALTPLALSWRQQSNEGLPDEQGRLSLVLDMELKFMDGAWPATLDGSTSEDRIIMKQVRTLDRAMRVPADLQELPVPRDVLEVSSLIQRRTCATEGFTLITDEVLTDASYASLLPYDVHPFIGRIRLSVIGELEGLDLTVGDEVVALHTQLLHAQHPQVEGGGGWSLDAQISPEHAASLGLSRLVAEPDGGWTLETPSGVASGDGLACQVEDLMVGPSQFLESLL